MGRCVCGQSAGVVLIKKKSKQQISQSSNLVEKEFYEEVVRGNFIKIRGMKEEIHV